MGTTMLCTMRTKWWVRIIHDKIRFLTGPFLLFNFYKYCYDEEPGAGRHACRMRVDACEDKFPPDPLFGQRLHPFITLIVVGKSPSLDGLFFLKMTQVEFKGGN